MSGTIRIHRLPGRDIDIEPAPVNRRWMDATPQRFAYRCLPLNIANSYGWQVSLQSGFRVRLVDGANGPDLEFDYDDPSDPPAVSHFGSGIVTFHLHAVFQTDPGTALYATGPVNAPKQGIVPLSGIIETDWLPFPFTMNWRLMIKGLWIRFEKGEPFCMVFPVKLAELEETRLEISDLADTPEFAAQVTSFTKDRTAFLKNLQSAPEDADQPRWQKHYFKGASEHGSSHAHVTSLKLARPVAPDKD